MFVLSEMVDEARDVNTHIPRRNRLQSRKTCCQQIACRVTVAEKVFEIGCSELDQCPEKICLLSLSSSGMPQALEDFVTFPPVGVIVEIDSVEILVGPPPLLGARQDSLDLFHPI